MAGESEGGGAAEHVHRAGASLFRAAVTVPVRKLPHLNRTLEVAPVAPRLRDAIDVGHLRAQHVRHAAESGGERSAEAGGRADAKHQATEHHGPGRGLRSWICVSHRWSPRGQARSRWPACHNRPIGGGSADLDLNHTPASQSGSHGEDDLADQPRDGILAMLKWRRPGSNVPFGAQFDAARGIHH